MKNIKKILIAIALVCCLSVGAVGCGDSIDGNNENNQANVTDQVDVSNLEEDTSSQEENQGETSVEDGATTSSENETSTSAENVETVALTDSQGNEVTDDKGNIVTQKVVNNNSNSNSNNSNSDDTTTKSDDNSNNNDNNNATTTKTDSNSNNNDSNSSGNNNVIQITDSNSNNNNNNSSNNSNNNNSTNNDTTQAEDNSIYFAKNRYTTMLWMSEDTSNYYESGAMAEITFKVLDDAQTGTYPVELNYIEIYDTNGIGIPFTVQNSTIEVGKELSVSEQGAATSGTNYRLDNATAQPGDIVKIKLYIDNNVGMAITKIELKYDNKALEVQSVNPTGVFVNEIIEANLNGERTSKK